VAGTVVGHYPLGGDPRGGEERVGAVPERGGGIFALISMNLAVSQAGVIVDSGVQVGVADHRMAVAPCWCGGAGVAPALGPAHRPPPAAIRDVAELLDVDVDQL